MAVGKRDIEPLEAALGHRFADRDLAGLALTHVSAAPSARHESYQRLEFLGDRVLGIVVAAMLYDAFPDSDEGELSQRLADLVRKESCADVALDWDVGSFLRLGDSERHKGPRNKAILGDVCEALIGAVFLDGGFAAARDVIVAAFEPRMRSPQRPLRDSKTVLQEWAQSRGLPTPAYRQIARAGPDHAPLFTIAVAIQGYVSAEAQGGSKRAAEQAAATVFLAREQVGQTELVGAS